jgi:hypothetical protein
MLKKSERSRCLIQAGVMQLFQYSIISNPCGFRITFWMLRPLSLFIINEPSKKIPYERKPWRHGAEDIASASGPDDPGSNPTNSMNLSPQLHKKQAIRVRIPPGYCGGISFKIFYIYFTQIHTVTVRIQLQRQAMQ